MGSEDADSEGSKEKRAKGEAADEGEEERRARAAYWEEAEERQERLREGPLLGIAEEMLAQDAHLYSRSFSWGTTSLPAIAGRGAEWAPPPNRRESQARGPGGNSIGSEEAKNR